MDWVIENWKVFFSGVGVVLVTSLTKFIRRSLSNESESKSNQNNTQNVTAPITNNIFSSGSQSMPSKEPTADEEKLISLEELKDKTRVLFIDDDRHFNVVKILKKSGWVHTKLVKDITAINQPELEEAHILFVDVQGVGVEMGFNDEGLGLALAIKNQYSDKIVIIYSSETKGERFHKALQRADASLPKNADPYEFQQLVQAYAEEIFN